MHLIVRPDGALWWRFKYRLRGREQTLSVGTFPTVDLARAREKAEEIRRQLDGGIDPSIARKAKKLSASDSFAAFADAWIRRQAKAEDWADNTAIRNTRVLGYFKRELGKLALTEIDAKMMLDALRAIEEHSPEAASRARRMASLIYQAAILEHRAAIDPAHGLAKALNGRKAKNRAAITDARKFGKLIRDIDAYEGQPSTKACLRFLAETFVRPSEASNAVWSEFDLDAAQWIIPAGRTKQRREHAVPLSTQVLELLSELAKLSDHYLFPGLRAGRPITNNGLNAALRSMGYDGSTHTAHGFRSSAATLLHEQGSDPAVIDVQLAHIRQGVAGVYNRSTLLPQRRELMQHWSDYLHEHRHTLRH